jgi:uncharacterized protein YdaU (DUF1376 family)
MRTPWFKWFPSDYMADTMRLTAVEDCMYRRLLDAYYLQGGPFENNMQRIRSQVRANSPTERTAIREVLDSYFVLENNRFHNRRADLMLLERAEVIEKKQKASEKRWKGHAHAYPHASPHASPSRSRSRKDHSKPTEDAPDPTTTLNHASHTPAGMNHVE